MNRKLFVGILMLTVASIVHATPEDGKAIFVSRCAACHNVNKVLTGPALAGVHERHSMDWIVNFVRSSQTLVKGGDKEAVALFQRFNGITMPDHTDLTPDNVKSIVEYIKTAAVSTDTKAPLVKPTKLTTAYTPLSIKTDYVVLILFAFVVFCLIMTLLFLVRLAEFKKEAALRKL